MLRIPSCHQTFFFCHCTIAWLHQLVVHTIHPVRAWIQPVEGQREHFTALPMTRESCVCYAVCSFPWARAEITVGWVKSVCQHSPPPNKWQQSCKMLQPHREILLSWHFPRASAQLSKPGIPWAWQPTAGWVKQRQQNLREVLSGRVRGAMRHLILGNGIGQTCRFFLEISFQCF